MIGKNSRGRSTDLHFRSSSLSRESFPKVSGESGRKFIHFYGALQSSDIGSFPGRVLGLVRSWNQSLKVRSLYTLCLHSFQQIFGEVVTMKQCRRT